MNFRKYLIVLLSVAFLACQEDDQQFGDIVAPSNLSIETEIVGADADNPNGDGSGVVVFTAQADNAIAYSFTHNGNKKHVPSGSASFVFSNLGVNSYTVSVAAYGTAGVSSSETIEVEVLATYEPPQDLLDKLLGDGSRSWRIKSEAPGHFGLGPVGGDIPTEFFGTAPDEKAGVGMYDDRYIFNEDGSFTVITNNTNDADGVDPSGTVFGRVNLVDELGSSGGQVNGADVENLPLEDFEETWTLIAPGGVETISLSGLGFIGYYTGGNHNYEIFDRSVPNEMILRTTDGNGEFDWWFIITYE